MLTTHNKILESQIVQQVSSYSIPHGTLLSKPKRNPKEYCNCIVLRSGRQLEGHKGVRMEVESENIPNECERANPSPS